MITLKFTYNYGDSFVFIQTPACSIGDKSTRFIESKSLEKSGDIVYVTTAPFSVGFLNRQVVSRKCLQ